MATGVRDASGNNLFPIGDIAKESTAPAVQVGAPYDPSSADTDLDTVARGFYVGVLGNLNIVDADGNVRLLTGLVAGSVIDIQIKGTRAASTTTTLINPLY